MNLIEILRVTLKMNLVGAMETKLADGPYRVFVGPVQVIVADGWREPDAVVVCSPVPERNTTVDNPVVLFELIS